ncbi:CDP-glycerol glycerophosphotransferase family protein [soil metagenome]
MPLLQDAATARRVLRNLWNSRNNRRQLAARGSAVSTLPSGSIQIAVYFADTAVNLYQMRQWYEPLRELAKIWPVAIISRAPSAALKLLDESPVPVVYLRSIAEVENFVEAQDLRIVLYVNQNSKNFQMFRYGRMWHVFINHGESDKMYMTTNQFKAYDYSLIAGEAARDRLGAKLWNFDLDDRTLMIGRPQADHFVGELPYTPDDRTVVLYAPTWEGDRESAAYGSVASHGEALVAALLASSTHRVIYRPHPRSGVIDAEFKRANEAIIAAIAAANARDASAQHVYDDGPTLGWQLSAADVAISDISAMVYDRLAVGKPLLVTRPASPNADVDDNGYLGAAEWLEAADAPSIVSIIDRVRHSEEAQRRLDYWVGRHFGDTTPGEATKRFHGAIATLLERWDAAAAAHAADPVRSETDPFAADAEDLG